MKLTQILKEIADDQSKDIAQAMDGLSKKDVLDIGFKTTDEVSNLSFNASIKNVTTQTPGVKLHQIIEIGVFDLPDGYRKEVKLKPYHLIFGDSSLAIFDAFNTNSVAGLHRRDCEQHLDNLQKSGKTEIDDAFIGGLVNFAGPTMFEFFNLAVFDRPGNEYRIIPHEAVHVARNLISFFENPTIDTREKEWYLKSNAQNFTKLEDASEEFFAEVIERASEIGFTRWNKVKKLIK